MVVFIIVSLTLQAQELRGFEFEVCIGSPVYSDDSKPIFGVGKEVLRGFGIYNLLVNITITIYLLVRKDTVSQSVMV